ncbi:diacylglycerol kinase family lipid kinase [Corynebacterium sp. sy017]|uniref:diacylglycerol/lipid kinase family protein n=1 Tax=unclassified Corynebacterium TaxID=2624378 RepID=UPI001185F89C|nr:MULTISPECIES: diacylglycerol kinase family protein [unclassified Corynebacterium]MBP3089211.1 diacylglycerol kinase family lipid kinase [Corynebacterium sp. sy017]QDZ43151.1 diacylglycerol kinase family lipid kinase [Corynebacterium sp. sy039]TSD91082.1 diacylglycerol kinase family lipid kinase [Corynebacterium sp. SY003]
MRALLISNPHSTTQTATLFSRIIPILRAVPGMELLSVFTQRAGHARQMCEQLMAARRQSTPLATNADPTLEKIIRFNPDTIIAVGGDGTVNEVINGLLGTVSSATTTTQGTQTITLDDVPTLGVIPTGSANVFVRALGFPQDPIHATQVLAHTLEHQQKRRIELGTWEDQWFAVNAGFGIDANVIAEVERARERGFAATPLRYLRVALRAWLKTRRQPPHIDVHAVNRDNEVLELQELPICMASNTNPWTFLGPLPVVTNPRNSFDLGLSIFALEDISGIGGVASMIHLVGIGKHQKIKKLIDGRTRTFDDATSIILDCHAQQRFQVDGEYAGKYEKIRLGAVADALCVYAPIEKVQPTPLSKLRVAFSFFDFRL